MGFLQIKTIKYIRVIFDSLFLRSCWTNWIVLSRFYSYRSCDRYNLFHAGLKTHVPWTCKLRWNKSQFWFNWEEYHKFILYLLDAVTVVLFQLFRRNPLYCSWNKNTPPPYFKFFLLLYLFKVRLCMPNRVRIRPRRFRAPLRGYKKVGWKIIKICSFFCAAGL